MKVRQIPFNGLLSNVVDNRGKTCPTSETGMPLIATNCIRNDLLYPAFEKVRYVSRETYDNWFRGHPEPDDLIFVTKGTPGRVCMAPAPINFCIAQDMVAIRADNTKVCPKFLFALLRSPATQTLIEQLHVGTLIPHFKKGDFDKLILPIPDRGTQEFIGEAYFELSAKIELNRRMNETLEAMARAIFKSWFVDFDPVRAKMDGRQPPGMNADTAALFPGNFEQTELGLVPGGWRVGTIRDCCQRIENGGTPKRHVEEFWSPLEIPWLTSGEVRQRFIVKTDNYISKGGLDGSSAKLWPAKTTVVALYGATAGYSSLLGFELCANQACCALIPKQVCSHFTFLLVSSSLIHFQQQVRGSAQQNLSQSIVANLPVAIPRTSILECFDHLMSPLIQRCIENLRESETLAATRDALLPKLLSGNIRSMDLERAT